MKVKYSREFLENFTGSQEELDQLTQQVEEAFLKGEYELDEEPVSRPTLH
jgi:hypothetical protein